MSKVFQGKEAYQIGFGHFNERLINGFGQWAQDIHVAAVNEPSIIQQGNFAKIGVLNIDTRAGERRVVKQRTLACR